jgi:hypothetical protein
MDRRGKLGDVFAANAAPTDKKARMPARNPINSVRALTYARGRHGRGQDEVAEVD